MFERTTLATVLGIGLALPILAATAATARALPASRGLTATIGLLLAAATFAGVLALRGRLPPSLDGAAQRHRVRALLWGLLAILSIALWGRQCAFMADPTQTWASIVPSPEVARHQCMSAYVRAAELSRDGAANVYDEAHWPAFDALPGHAAPPRQSTSVAELDGYVSDPYEYPPPFLLLPRLGLLVTNHFLVLRAGWFALQALAFILVALALARWIGGRAGLRVGLLVPAVVASAPGLFGLQFGQAHLLTYVLCLGALVAFARGRAPVGGALLGVATVCKLFPGLLLVFLALRRRWRDLGWTLAAAAALTLLSLAVVGTAPFVAFVRYQLPRIGTGEAFSFFRADWHGISANFSVGGIAFKLGLLGLWPSTSLDHVASGLGWIYTLLLLGLAVRMARRDDGDRLACASAWLGLLNLAALRSPLAPSAYVTLGALWLLSLLAARVRSGTGVALVVAAWLLIPGIPPLANVAVDVASRLAGQLVMVALSVYVVWRPRGEPQALLRVAVEPTPAAMAVRAG